MKPFLLLSTRDHDGAALAEHRSVARHAGLRPGELRHLRVEAGPVGDLSLDAYAGVFLGGSAFNVSDADKSPLQQRVEADLARLLDRIVDEDLPFLGMCYGIGSVTKHLGGLVDRTYSEPVGATSIALTDAGRADALLDGVPDTFEAFVGHKEACNGVPPGAVLLAEGERCPVQMYRVGRNVYVTQYHPELDAADLEERMRIYQHAGYFRPEELEDLVAMARASGVDGSVHRVLANFTRRYATE